MARTSFNTRVRESLGQIVACIPGIINGNYDPAKARGGGCELTWWSETFAEVPLFGDP